MGNSTGKEKSSVSTICVLLLVFLISNPTYGIPEFIKRCPFNFLAWINPLSKDRKFKHFGEEKTKAKLLGNNVHEYPTSEPSAWEQAMRRHPSGAYEAVFVYQWEALDKDGKVIAMLDTSKYTMAELTLSGMSYPDKELRENFSNQANNIVLALQSQTGGKIKTLRLQRFGQSLLRAGAIAKEGPRVEGVPVVTSSLSVSFPVIRLYHDPLAFPEANEYSAIYRMKAWLEKNGYSDLNVDFVSSSFFETKLHGTTSGVAKTLLKRYEKIGTVGPTPYYIRRREIRVPAHFSLSNFDYSPGKVARKELESTRKSK